MRIIGGTCRGRRLTTPGGRKITRPTSDRVRESIFNIISPRIGNARVLDLFAGTGALGMEALSRGAEFAGFVDNSHDACSLIKENIALLGMEDRSEIIHRDLGRSSITPFSRDDGKAHARRGKIRKSRAQTCQVWTKKNSAMEKKFDLVFMDPPYGMGLIETTLATPGFTDILAQNALIVCEHPFEEDLGDNLSNLDILSKFDIKDQRKYGKTGISFLTLQPY